VVIGSINWANAKRAALAMRLVSMKRAILTGER
jgi:hypothetical protein